MGALKVYFQAEEEIRTQTCQMSGQVKGQMILAQFLGMRNEATNLISQLGGEASTGSIAADLTGQDNCKDQEHGFQSNKAKSSV